MTMFTPGLVRNPQTGQEEPGLIEIFVPMLPGRQCERTPQFRPLYLLTKANERVAVLDWLTNNRPDLLPRSRRPG
jgi:hypothetical protein